jgi:polysaccharide deacetylase 2 family uncharacterized protein YibQ
MAASAILRGAFTGRLGGRSPGRLSVVAWAVAATAVLAAAASAFLNDRPAAFALVPRTSEPVASVSPASIAAVPSQALIDPRAFRKPPPPADGRPRLAIIVGGLGVSATLTAAAIETLPPDVSLSFSPYGRMLQKQADTARAAGHEIFIDIPLEPQGFPGNDAGPQAILGSLPAAENVERLRWSLARFTGFAGLVLAGGSPALNSPETVTPLLQGASVDGLVWVHAKVRGFAGSRAETAEIALAIDGKPEGRSIDSALERLEALARFEGSALAVAGAYPVTVQRLAAWAEGLEARGVVLVPASALAKMPPSQSSADARPASVESPPPVSDAHGAHP